MHCRALHHRLGPAAALRPGGLLPGAAAPLEVLAGGGYSAVAPSVAETMEAGFLPALDEDQADMF